MSLLVFVPFLFSCINAGLFKAGAAKVDISFDLVQLGCPLAGFNHGARRVPYWPLPVPRRCTTWMEPNTGVLDPLHAKALAIYDGVTYFMFVTMDAIGSDSTLNNLAYDIAVGQGFSIPKSNIIFSSSHSHSGPGAISPEFLWSIAPATDIMSPEAQRATARSMASAMLQAVSNMEPAMMNVGMETLLNVTVNRRCGRSPVCNCQTIDPHLGLIRVDNALGQPLATLWNFAIHGVCYSADNMKYSADIMGYVNNIIEETLGGLSLFMNADAGDIDPAHWVCGNAPKFNGGPVIAQAVMDGRAKIVPSKVGTLNVISEYIPFGPTNLNFTLARWSNCTSGGPLDICTLCAAIGCEEDLALYSNWIENNPRFTALKLLISGKSTIIGTMPGEALLELGWWLRNDTQRLGYDNTLLAGYSNSHMGYFATPIEYDVGGYESQLTLWGIGTAAQVRKGFDAVVTQVTKQGISPKRKSLFL